MLCSNFTDAFTPFMNISVDEMIIGFKGCWKYRQFNATKPKKYHIKGFGLVDSTTGHVLNLLTYYRKDTSYNTVCDPDSGHAIKAFDTLLICLGNGYQSFTDWLYTRNLVDFLLSKKLYYSGMLQSSRKGFPQDLKSLSLGHMESSDWPRKDEKILCTAWKGEETRKPVLLVTTNGNVTHKQKVKPSAIRNYSHEWM